MPMTGKVVTVRWGSGWAPFAIGLLIALMTFPQAATEDVTDLHIAYIQPTSGPVGGGTNLIMHLPLVVPLILNETVEVRFQNHTNPTQFVPTICTATKMSTEELDGNATHDVQCTVPPLSNLTTATEASSVAVTVELTEMTSFFFVFTYYSDADVATETKPLQPAEASSFGGTQVTISGKFPVFVSSKSQRVRLQGATDDTSQLQATTELLYGTETTRTFIMPELALPQGMNSSLFWVEVSFNGQDYTNTSQKLTVSSLLDPMKVCFMFFNKLDNEPGWTYASNYGRLRLESTLRQSVQVVIEDQVRGHAAALQQAKKFIEMDCKIILGIHVTHRNAHLAQLEYPDKDVKFVLGGEFPKEYMSWDNYNRTAFNGAPFPYPNTTGSVTGTIVPNVGSCFPKLIETRYLAGIIAGRMTKTNIIGYVVSFKLPQTTRQVNAFTMGVREVNPNATVVVYQSEEWNSNDRDVKIGRLLLEQGADMVTQHTNGLELQHLFHDRGHFSFGIWSNYAATEGVQVLVSALNLWGPCFIEYTRQVMYDRWQDGQAFFFGLEQGYSDISPMSAKVPLEVQAEVLSYRQKFLEGRQLFCGGTKGMRNNAREVVIAPGECLTDKQLESPERMSFYVEGVLEKGKYDACTCDPGERIEYKDFTFDCAARTCKDCRGGTQLVENECVECKAGEYGVNGTCYPCEPGSFSSTGGQEQCEKCPAGFHQSLEGQVECEGCAAGWFADKPGQKECERCNMKSYAAAANATRCEPCPPNMAAEVLGATSVDECKCAGNFFNDSNVCAACPVTVLSITAAPQTEEAAAPERPPPCARMERCASVMQRSTLMLTLTERVEGNSSPYALSQCKESSLDGRFGDSGLKQFLQAPRVHTAVKDLVVQQEVDGIFTHVSSGLQYSGTQVIERNYVFNITSDATTGLYLLEVQVEGKPTSFSPIVYQVEVLKCQRGYENDDGFCKKYGNDMQLTLVLTVVGCTLALVLLFLWLYYINRSSMEKYLREVMLHRNPPQEGEDLTICITDIEGSTALWDKYPAEMNAALQQHDNLMRTTMKQHHGYELLTEGDSFIVAFHRAEDAINWCMEVQRELTKVKWSATILEATAHEKCDKFRGLRVRAGIHSGKAEHVKVHPNTKRVQYGGSIIPICKGVQGAASGGQVLLSGDTLGRLGVLSGLEQASTELATSEVYMVHLGLHQLEIVDTQPTVEGVMVDIDLLARENSYSAQQTLEEGIMEEGKPVKRQTSKLGCQQEYEIAMVLPKEFKEREDHFLPIKTVLKMTPSYYEAPSYRNVTNVFTYVEQADTISKSLPEEWASALELHNELLRKLLVEHNGYECREAKGQFLLAFHSAMDAVLFGVNLQEALLRVPWPTELLAQPAACRMMINGFVIFRGLRVQMGIVTGPVLEVKPCRRTGRAEYFGPQLNKCARIATTAHGGQLLVGKCTFSAMDPRVMHELSLQSSYLGRYSLKGVTEVEAIHQISHGRMLLRPFPGIKAQRKRGGPRADQASMPETPGFTPAERPSILTCSINSSINSLGPRSMTGSTRSEAGYSHLIKGLEKKILQGLGEEVPPKLLPEAKVCVYINDTALQEQVNLLLNGLIKIQHKLVDTPPILTPAEARSLLKEAAGCKLVVLHAGDSDTEASLALIQAVKAGGGPPVLLLSGADLKDEAVKDATVVPVPLADGALLAALQKALGLDIIAPSSNTSSDSRPFKQRIDAESGLGSAAEDRDGAVVQQSAASISRRSIMSSRHNSIPKEDDEKILDETLLEALTVRTQTAASTRSRRASYTTVLNTTATFHDASVKLELNILALLGASIDTTDDGKVVDPFLENLRSHCATRGHNIELVFSLRDAVFMLSKVIQGQDSFSNGQMFLPQLVVIDGREMDTEATMETLVKVREFDPQRVSILVSLLLPTKSTSKLPLKQYFEAGADLFSQATANPTSVEQLLNTAESNVQRNTYLTKSRVLMHALQQIEYGVEIIDINGRIQWVNSAWEQSLQYKLAEVKGLPIDMVDSKSRPGFWRRRMRAMLRDPDVETNPFRGHCLARRASGDDIHQEAHMSLLLSAQGHPQFFITIKKDIQELGSTLTLTLAEGSESDEESEGSSPREGILVGSSSASLPLSAPATRARTKALNTAAAAAAAPLSDVAETVSAFVSENGSTAEVGSTSRAHSHSKNTDPDANEERVRKLSTKTVSSEASDANEEKLRKLSTTTFSCE